MHRLYLNGILTPNAFRQQMGEIMGIHLVETRETKATLTAETGRVLAWHNDKEAGYISLAVPDARARLTPSQAIALAEWLYKQANDLSAGYRTAVPKVSASAPFADKYRR